MQRITPFLWFNDQAEEAVNFYVSIFDNSMVKNTTRYNEAGAQVSGRPKNSVMTIVFELEGQEFVALNGGPEFTFTPAISLVVNCTTQLEVDEYWRKLSEGGSTEQCGWLKDKYGISWQIVPTVLGEMLSSPDPQKTEKVMKAMLQMRKIDMKTLKDAFDQ
ncbi:MAG: VOC family protein [Gammaproteobacteria bacterium]|jgi:predicted 3-demethylubiquinone-9 3-methyltransferase (glyoxalase superfamily)|nr:VOC family protein [Gammaproteobacteria bacterium]